MPLISDDQAGRLRDLASRRAWSTDAGRWIKALLADREDRIALLQRASRQIESARRELGRGELDRDLETRLRSAKKTADAPWSGQQLCQACGAPAIRVGTEGANSGLVITHPDGRRCRVA